MDEIRYTYSCVISTKITTRFSCGQPRKWLADHSESLWIILLILRYLNIKEPLYKHMYNVPILKKTNSDTS